MGEVGCALFNLLEKQTRVYGDDIASFKRKGDLTNGDEIEIVHMCIPYGQFFTDYVVSCFEKYRPSLLTIHGTVKPGTTLQVQNNVSAPVVFSPVRGVHSRMEFDLKRYTKFYASYSNNEDAVRLFVERFRAIGVSVKQYHDPLTLEYAKILCDTTYYGWLIIFAQRTKMLCDEQDLNYDELWQFAEEIHDFLGNRPKMFPGSGIGGHCVIPNLDLLEDEFFKLIGTQDQEYRRHLDMVKRQLKHGSSHGPSRPP